MKKIFYLMLVALTVGMFTACDDDDENTPQINNPEPKEQWGKTLRGDNQTLLAFPDIYADYWEYTYSYKDNPNIGLRLTGKFPLLMQRLTKLLLKRNVEYNVQLLSINVHVINHFIVISTNSNISVVHLNVEAH